MKPENETSGVDVHHGQGHPSIQTERNNSRCLHSHKSSELSDLDSLKGDTSSVLSLLDLTTGRFTEVGRAAGGTGAEYGTFPTQRRHSKASPRARSQRPISLGGNPASFAHVQFE